MDDLLSVGTQPYPDHLRLLGRKSDANPWRHALRHRAVYAYCVLECYPAIRVHRSPRPAMDYCNSLSMFPERQRKESSQTARNWSLVEANKISSSIVMRRTSFLLVRYRVLTE